MPEPVGGFQYALAWAGEHPILALLLVYLVCQSVVYVAQAFGRRGSKDDG